MPRTNVAWKSNIPNVVKGMERANMYALGIAAGIPRRKLKKLIAFGYTTGEYSKGIVAKTIKTFRDRKNGAVYVYTRNRIASAWEFGHFNLFLKTWIRVDYWNRVFAETRNGMRDAWGRAMKRYVERAATRKAAAEFEEAFAGRGGETQFEEGV